MSDELIALLAALAGALVGYFTGKRLACGVAQHKFTIHITESGGVYSSKTTPPKKGVMGGDWVFWKITQAKALPAGSLIQLEFPAGSCLVHDKPNDGKGGAEISTFVKYFQDKKAYPYKIYYIDSGGVSHLLEDPELIIEGDQRIKIH